MTAKLRRTAFGALALLLGFAPLACASSSNPSPQPPPVPRREEMKKEEKPAKPQPTGPASETESRTAGEAAYRSTYQPLPSQPVLITNATVLTATGERIERGSVLMRDGQIAAVGASLQAPAPAPLLGGSA